MIGYTTLLWAVSSGFCLYASVLHLQMGLRKPRDRVHWIFGLLALTAALAIFGNTQMVTAQTPERYQSVVWFSSTFVTLLYGLVPCFVTVYANEPKRLAAYSLAGMYGIVLVGNFFHPHSMLLSGPPELAQVTYSWGETITRAKTPPSDWVRMLWLSHVFLLAYLVYACIGLYKRGPRSRALSLTVGVSPFALSVILNLLVHLGVISIPYTAAFGFLFIVILMSTALTREWRSAASQMHIVLDNVPAVVYLKNVDGRYRFVNRQFERLYGLTPGTARGKTDVELFDASRGARQRDMDQQVLASDRILESEQAIVQNGETHTYSSLHFALRDADGCAYALCGIATDITERKAAADVLRELTANLERRVARRTRDLAELNGELEAFAYSVSHDLRAPLMTVHGFADLLLRDYAPSLDQTAQKYVQRIREGAKRMTGLIEDLLALSRVTRTAPQRIRVNLATIAHDVLRTLRENEPLRAVAVDVAAELPIQADPNLIAVVMQNLVGNAWKYTGKRSDARIEVGSTIENNETIYFVRDNGAGFDPRYAERLFQPFKRLHSEQDFPGNGIGLATVARIVHRHGGRIWADSKPQAGATFYFTLPTPDEESVDHDRIPQRTRRSI